MALFLIKHRSNSSVSDGMHSYHGFKELKIKTLIYIASKPISNILQNSFLYIQGKF
jgi:hypothetical protein